MNRLFTIFARECHRRLASPSLWVLAVAVPILLTLLYALPIISAHQSTHRARVLVVDQTGLFSPILQSTQEVGFVPTDDLDLAQKQLSDDPSVDALLFIPLRQTTIPHDAFLYHRRQAPTLAVQSVIDNQLQQILRNAILRDVYHVEPSTALSLESAHVRLRTLDANTGRESFAQVKSVVGYALAGLMVIALILFSTQAMRSIQEERQSRIVEVIATSVRPTQMLAGKLLAIFALALMQIVLWATLTWVGIQIVEACDPDLFTQARLQQQIHALATKGTEATAQFRTPIVLVDETVRGLTAINLPLLLSTFTVAFLLGFLLYGALIAAIAARLDSDADAVQWALIMGSPLLIAMILSPIVVGDPMGAIAKWLSIIPFTAPVSLMLRLPFGIPVGQLILAFLIMSIFLVGAMIWAGQSYRRNLLRP